MKKKSKCKCKEMRYDILMPKKCKKYLDKVERKKFWKNHYWNKIYTTIALVVLAFTTTLLLIHPVITGLQFYLLLNIVILAYAFAAIGRYDDDNLRKYKFKPKTREGLSLYGWLQVAIFAFAFICAFITCVVLLTW